MSYDEVVSFVIFDFDGNVIAEVPFVKDDPNHGLPDWFYEDNYVELQTDGNGKYGAEVGMGCFYTCEASTPEEAFVKIEEMIK